MKINVLFYKAWTDASGCRRGPTSKAMARQIHTEIETRP